LGGITLGISGERQFNVHEKNAVARVRCMPLLCGGVDANYNAKT
jgi:hypothetical protein